MSESEEASPIRKLVIVFVIAAAIIALFIAQRREVFDRGEPLGRVHFGRLAGGERTPQTVPMALAANRRLTFTVLMSSYQSTRARRDDLMFRIEPLRAGEPLMAQECLGYRARNTSSRGIVGTNNTCAMTVPEPGADALRMTAWFESGQANIVVEGLSVEVRGEP